MLIFMPSSASLFFAFVVSCFGSFGPTAVRCLFSLADLQLRQHDSILARQGLPPLLDPSVRSQFRAICYRQISARLGLAVAISRKRFCHAPPWSSSSSCTSACPSCSLGLELPWPCRFLLPSPPSHLCFLPLLAPSFLVPFPFPCFFPVTFLST